jgi:tetratricopeptide (TPR) repeat protein
MLNRRNNLSAERGRRNPEGAGRYLAPGALRSLRAPFLLMFLFVLSISAGSSLLVRQQQAEPARLDQGFMEALMGESRRLFASHFFVKADAYFLGGYYPSIFEQARRRTYMEEAEQQHSEGKQGRGRPTPLQASARSDWIERFGKKFSPQLEGFGGKSEVQEMLPWLEIAVQLDPHRVEFYLMTAHLLRTHLNAAEEAVRLLRRGWQLNPDSYEILFHLGRVFYEEFGDATRARNLYEQALETWKEQAELSGEPDWLVYRQMVGQAGRLEEEQGNYEQAISFYEKLKAASTARSAIEEHIEQLRGK